MRTLVCVYAYSILSYPTMCMQVLASRTILHTPFYHLITDRPTCTILRYHIFFFTELQDFMFRWCVDILSLSLSLSSSLSLPLFVSIPLYLRLSFSICIYTSQTHPHTRPHSLTARFCSLCHTPSLLHITPSPVHIRRQILRSSSNGGNILTQPVASFSSTATYCFLRLVATAGRGRTIQMEGSAHLILIFRRHN